MPSSPPPYLVVGADSMVGGALITRLRQNGVDALGTTRRPDRVSQDCLLLDLAQDVRDWRPPRPVAVAILCAGVTGLRACEADAAGSAKVNVEAIAQLARNLQRNGTFVIGLSTNQVFDGSVAFRSPRDAVCPCTEYGRQKAELERRLGEGGAVAAVVRFTKILGPRTSLFSGWGDALRRGRPVEAYSDMVLAPVPLSCAVKVLLQLAERRLAGLFQVSGDRDVSYETAARIGARALGADARLVRPVHAPSGREPLPAHTTLNMDAIEDALGIRPPDVPQVIETAFVNPARLE